jgi:hypothetical protein
MGVFIAQVLTVMLAVALMLISLAVLSLAMRRGRRENSPAMTVNPEPCSRDILAVDRKFDSIFAMQTALPSRAPPISSLLRVRARFALPSAGGAGGLGDVTGVARFIGTRSVHVEKLAFA